MAKNLFRAPNGRIQLEEIDGDVQAPEKIQLIRTGKFRYFDDSLEITEDMLKSFVKNFQDNVRGVDLAIDYAHMNHLEAAAWVKDLEIIEQEKEMEENSEESQIFALSDLAIENKKKDILIEQLSQVVAELSLEVSQLKGGM